MIRVGTRGSPLALAQARWVAERIGDDTTLVTITTAGDRGANLLDKSQWVAELEHALLEGLDGGVAGIGHMRMYSRLARADGRGAAAPADRFVIGERAAGARIDAAQRQ